MRFTIFLIIFFIFFDTRVLAQLQLQGIINVWNNDATIITLTDDFYYALAPGDEIKIIISGTANIAPYDEQRKGGGFLGLFKKRYTVRIDNWLTADQVKLRVRAANTLNSIDYADFALTADATAKTQTAIFTVPFNEGRLKDELLQTLKIKAFVNQSLSPLRAGKYDVVITVNSVNRLDRLQQYFTATTEDPQRLPILSFENDIKKFVENGKLIYRHPNETVQVIADALLGKPSLDAIKKDMYKYLLQFAPDNTSVRAQLSDVYLKELNFTDARLEAQQTIILLSKKSDDELTSKEQNDFGQAYEVLAGVNELKELGLQQDAYSLAALFFGQAADRYRRAKSTEKFTKTIMNQVRCLQKIGGIVALKQAAKILNEYHAQVSL